LDGALSEDERAELERVLLSSPRGRAVYWRHARLHADAARWGQEEWGRRMAAEPERGAIDAAAPLPLPILEATTRRDRLTEASPPKRPSRILRRVAIAACLAIAAAVLVNRTRPPGATDVATPTTSVIPATAPAGVAVLASTVDARWTRTSDAWPPGAVLSPGAVLKLTSGAAQVEFYSGARLVLQGPVEVELRSEMEAVCRAGRVTAQVPPPARGFTVRGGGVSVVDLGTEFGLNLPTGGPPQVHVFSGRVDVSPASPSGAAPAVSLSAGEAAEFPDGNVRRVPAAPESFLRGAAYARLADGDLRKRQAAWQQAVARLSSDPAALVHYTFPEDQFRARTIGNGAAAAASRGAGSAASVVGCAAADGRWPPSRAVEFRGPGDRMRLEIGPSFAAVTLFAWVRFDTLPNTYHALLAPDGIAEGTLRWGLTGRGELRLAIARRGATADANWEAVISEPVLTATRLGRWTLLVSTFDGKSIRHYLDGRLVKELAAYSPAALVIGPAEVGNWRGPTARFFRGRMDELAILSRAITAAELQALYEAGRPLESSAQ
jgi:hypothetical protein